MPSVSERNRTPNSTAAGSFAEVTVGTVDEFQMEHGQLLPVELSKT